MKKFWILQWETVPGDGEHRDKFTKLDDAKKAFRQKISQFVNLDEFFGDLDPRAGKFLHSYLSDPEFPRTAEDVPEEYEDPEHGRLNIFSCGIDLEYPYYAYPCLDTNLVLDSSSDDSYRFDFHYNYPEEAEGKGITELTMCIYMHIDYGNSAHPLMIWDALRKEPKTQDQIISGIYDVWQVTVDRKTVGRHLKTLKELGFPICHNASGYYYDGEFTKHEEGTKFGTSAYPLMILLVWDGARQTHAEIAQKVFERFGVKLERKAIGRHLSMLREMDMIREC